jgi:hypothetical protein
MKYLATSLMKRNGLRSAGGVCGLGGGGILLTYRIVVINGPNLNKGASG